MDDLTPLAVLELDKIDRDIERQEEVFADAKFELKKLKNRKKEILKQIEEGEL